MKTKISLISLALISALIFISSTCQKREDIRAVVTVKLHSDTTKVVPNANVRLTKYDIDVSGKTNAIGQWEHIFPDEVILDAIAWTVDSDGEVELFGESTIRLRDGRTTYKTIFVK